MVNKFKELFNKKIDEVDYDIQMKNIDELSTKAILITVITGLVICGIFVGVLLMSF